ncbi:DUF3566 domain-containing protein [Blastococcus sp. BMG 814]|uniref:DUF3566 domain-containing protein n=1 Tax=Blastococcus carthaginiensis TaxID=3050034 RepID=A0ABT9IJD9_9ACTN|nr:DUF3566 domain-containing protein [Blastococcus carthaginiensis]MDP5185185.1 DUF3566 domain-containing protein [Blastococcus carthaginiensis]
MRTDSRAGDGSAAESTPTDGKPAPTQSIPATGSQRAQAPGTGTAPVVPQPLNPATGATPAQQGAASQDAPQQAPSDDGDAPAGGPEGGAGPVGVGVGSARTGRGKAGRGPRRARLQVRHIDTWSALKISLMLSIALFFIWMVAVGLLYMVLGGLGVFEAVNDLFGQIGSASGAESTGDVVTLGVVFWGAAVIGAINVVLLTALCTVGTFIYNLCSDLVGGLEVTLSERD